VFVERRSMFGPIVQPPLILAIVVPLLVMITQGTPSGGLAAVGLKLGKPLIDGFPAMALTTAFTVILGIVRVMTQKNPNRPTKDEIREAKRRPDKPRRADRPDRADRAGRPERAEKPSSEDRPKRPRGGEPERRRPAPPPADEDRPKRPRPPAAGSADRPRRPAPPREGGRPPRRPRPPRDEG
jgi:hypothetical protein